MQVTRGVERQRVHEWYEAWNRRDWQAVETFISPEFSGQDNIFGQAIHGRAEFIKHCQEYIEAFSDAHLRLDRISGGVNGLFVVEYTGIGTQTGYFGLFAPLGRKVEFRLCDILNIQNELIVSCRTYGDLYRPLAELQHIMSRHDKLSA